MNKPSFFLVAEKVLGTESPVKVGLVLSLLGICASGFAVWIWWAATISAKLDNIIIQQTAQASLQSKISSDIEELKSWRKIVESVGSPQVQSLRNEVQDLEKKFEIHEMRKP